MALYSVKKGKHYFKGNKAQPIILQLALTIGFLSLSIFYQNWWWLIGAFFSFAGFYGLMQSEILMDSARIFFNKNCLYKLTDNYDQVNKIYGFSEGFHHWNSARIGWRCTDGENIELLAYCYVNGQRIIKPMIKCKPETWIFCNIQSKGSKYVLKALTPQKQSITISVDKPKTPSIYSLFKLFIYRLYPYFGGKISAPHNMNITIVKLHI